MRQILLSGYMQITIDLAICSWQDSRITASHLSSRTIGEKIRFNRKHEGLTHAQLANKINVDATCIGDWENMKYKVSKENYKGWKECLEYYQSEMLTNDKIYFFKELKISPSSCSCFLAKFYSLKNIFIDGKNMFVISTCLILISKRLLSIIQLAYHFLLNDSFQRKG